VKLCGEFYQLLRVDLDHDAPVGLQVHDEDLEELEDLGGHECLPIGTALYPLDILIQEQIKEVSVEDIRTTEAHSLENGDELPIIN